MEHAEMIKENIDSYMRANHLSEDELTVLFQLDFNDQENDYTIDYAVTSHEYDLDMRVDASFDYDTLAEAWDNFIDQTSELNESYQDAKVLHPDPEQYSGGKLGGNPVMSIRDAESEI